MLLAPEPTTRSTFSQPDNKLHSESPLVTDCSMHTNTQTNVFIYIAFF